MNRRFDRIPLRIEINERPQRALSRADLTVEELIAQIAKEFALTSEEPSLWIDGDRSPLPLNLPISQIPIDFREHLIFVSEYFEELSVEKNWIKTQTAARGTHRRAARLICKGTPFDLRTHPVTIGRGEGKYPSLDHINVMKLLPGDDSSISSEHAVLTRYLAHWYLIPINPNVQTTLNNEYLEGHTGYIVHEGDTIGISHLRFSFHLMTGGKTL